MPYEICEKRTKEAKRVERTERSGRYPALLRLLAVALVLSLVLTAAYQPAYAALVAFGDNEEATLNSFISQYGWDRNKMTAYEWVGLDGKIHTRVSSFEKAFADDVYTTCEDLAVELGLISRVDITGGNADSIIAVALAEVEAGETDVPIWSNNCKYNTWYYGHPVSGDSYPWCCAFISWCADQCGLIEDGTYRKTAGCAAMRAYFNERGYESFPIRSATCYGGSETPIPGDVIIWGQNQHIALIVEVHEDSLDTVEGNTYPRVARITNTLDTLRRFPNLGTGTIFRVQYPDTKATIFSFLVNTMGLSPAAACGIMANMEHESGFRPDALGDNGTSYGICQWHNVRWDRLKAFCGSEGYDWETLTGQLFYLQYELETFYPALLSQLRSVPNTGGGAYTAGYSWCVDFERPSDTYAKATSRGNAAKTIYWPLYGIGEGGTGSPSGDVNPNVNVTKSISAGETYRYLTNAASPGWRTVNEWRYTYGFSETSNVIGIGMYYERNSARVNLPAGGYSGNCGGITVTLDQYTNPGYSSHHTFNWAICTSMNDAAYMGTNAVPNSGTQLACGTFTTPCGSRGGYSIEIPVQVPGNQSLYLYMWPTTTAVGNFHMYGLQVHYHG